MEEKWDLLVTALGEMRVKENESLHYHTSSNSDIITKWFYLVSSQKELVLALNTVLELSIPYWILESDNLPKVKKDQVYQGIVIKNRSHQIKISGIKGKFNIGSMGIDQVLLEIDSGVNLEQINDYLLKNKLLPIFFNSTPTMTLGEVLGIEFSLQNAVETIKVWEKGIIDEVNVLEFDSKHQVIISAIIKVKSQVVV